MSQWKLVASTAAIALLAGNAALAAVTPEQVWEDWRALLGAYGQKVEVGSEARAGDTLVVSGLKMIAEQEGASSIVSVDELRFQDRGDGSVSVRMSETVPVQIVMPPIEGGKDVQMSMEMQQPGMEVIASGEPGNMRYDFTGPQMDIRLTGTESGTSVMDMSFGFSGMVGNYLVAGAETKTLNSSFKADAMTLSVSVNDPEGGMLKMQSASANITGVSNAVLPPNYDATNPAAALEAGMAVDGGISYGATDFSFETNADGSSVSGGGTFTGGDFNVVLNKGQIGYGASGQGAEMSFASSDLPFPEIKVSYADSGFNFVMPVAPTDDPSDFLFATKIVDLVISDEIWAMFDPMAQLPRDPVSIVVDTSGKARMMANLLDPEQAAEADDGTLGELRALQLNQLQVKGIGAEITGDGALTFDNSDLVSYGGMPAPTGTINLKAVGINGVMDKLVAMGLMPEDQVMGARMMLGMFARAVEGEADTVTSTLEFKGPSFFANGMQLQ